MSRFKKNYKIYVISLVLLCITFLVRNTYSISQHQQATNLDWIIDKTANNLCQGYYLEPNLNLSVDDSAPLEEGKIEIIGNGQLSFSQTGTSNLEDIIVSEPGQRVKADKAILIRDPKTHKINLIKLEGHVRLRQPGKLLIGQSGHMYLESKAAEINDAEYHVHLSHKQVLHDNQIQLMGLTAWGKALKINQVKPGLIKLQQASYTTCSPLCNDWHLKSQKLTLNKETGRGTARNVLFYVRQVPIFYTPYMSFPIDNRRLTGFLLPAFNYSSKSGYIFDLPLYLNLAPNLDDTFTPVYISKRGVMYMDSFRYKTRYTTGDLKAAILPGDKIFRQFIAPNNILTTYARRPLSAQTRAISSSVNRKFLFFHQKSKFNKHFSTSLDYNYTSDDYIFQDFQVSQIPGTPIINDNQLLRQASAEYKTNHWDVTGQFEKYQTLHPINSVSLFYDQYSRLPALNAHGDYLDVHGFDLSLDSQFVRFLYPDPTAIDFYSGRFYAQGTRINVEPSISYPISNLSGYIIPKAEFDMTHYQIQKGPTGILLTPQGVWPKRQINRTIPIISVDSGLTFEKNISLFGKGFIQTLEPRIYYLYVPNRDQNNIPIYDTIITAFNYDQMFRDNRFVGYDRIGNANQVAFGLTTRLLNNFTSAESAEASIGITRYFARRITSICSLRNCAVTINPRNSQIYSPLVGKSVISLIPDVSITTNLAYNLYFKSFETASVTATYTKDQRHIFYTSYVYSKAVGNNPFNPTAYSEEHTLSLGTIYGITKYLSLMGILSRQTVQNQVKPAHDFYIGVQYDTCCWAARLIVGKEFQGVTSFALPNQDTSSYDKRILFQVMFKGLGTLGTGDAQPILATGIPGLKDIFETERSI